MNPNTVTVANAFYVVAAVLGAPSLAATLLYSFLRLRLWLVPGPAGSSFDSVTNPDAILIILGALVRSLEKVASVVGGLAQWVAGVVAIVAGVILLLAVAFFLTGRGLHAQQDWARVTGGVMMLGLLLVSLVILLSVRGPLFLLSVGLVAASVYSLLGLWRGFTV